MKKILLKEGWKLHEAPLSWGKDMLNAVMAKKDGWLDCTVPCDIHTPLEEAGIIKDVVKADYCYDAEWTEKRSWWYVKTFDSCEIDPNAEVVELIFESLDTRADIFLNGIFLKKHINAHYPCVVNIRHLVQPGENTIAVRLTDGMEEVTDEMIDSIGRGICVDGHTTRGDLRRAFVRRPQYTIGWDWGPRAVTVGIVKDAYICCYNKVAFRGVHVFTEKIDRRGPAYDETCSATVKVQLELEQLNIGSTRDADIKIKLAPLYASNVTAGGKSNEIVLEKKDVLLTSGINYIEFTVDVENAELWWPKGYGKPDLYSLDAEVICEGVEIVNPTVTFGIRTIDIDVSRIDADRRRFALVINGVTIFCKGGDWIPADSIYARVSDEKYETLVSEAAEANFNCLRIWGGGIYEKDVFYECCDKYGVMVWHDFMLSCSTYPDDVQWFNDEFDREVDYQTKRLRNHASMCLWCGSNETQMMYNPMDGIQWDTIDDVTYEKALGLHLVNTNAKVIVQRNSPEIPYWNSSPYGGVNPNDQNIGDVHYWNNCMMNADMAKRIEPREYDKCTAPFVSEYGYPGAYHYESIKDTFGTVDIERDSDLWQLHNNTFEKETVNAGIMKHYSVDASKMPVKEYIMYSGLVQSTMLGYSLEALRFKDYCDGAMFWMYNDTWCEVGWTIIDYYLRRKNSFYGVRRAFDPVKFILRDDNAEFGGAGSNTFKMQACNDTEFNLKFANAQIGYMSFDGTVRELQPVEFVLKARSREYVVEAELPERDYIEGTVFFMPGKAEICDEQGNVLTELGNAGEYVDSEVAPARLRNNDISCLKMSEPKFNVSAGEIVGNDVVYTLSSEMYVHAVHIEEDNKCSDNYFDLAPGQVKKVTVYCGAGAEFEWKSLS